MKNITIAKKLPVMIILIGLINVVVISTVVSIMAKNQIQQADGVKLTAIAENRQASLDGYLSSLVEDIRSVRDNPFTLEALAAFSEGWNGVPGNKTETLQRLYITDNPNPTGEKENLDFATDGSAYSDAHKTYHPWFRNFLRARGYYDIFLFDLDGNLIYSVFKELDYATNLNTGEWAESDLGNSFRAARDAADATAVSFFDFKPYAPSADAPAAFMSTPIADPSGTKLGILVFQMPIDRINEVMQVAAGLGETGESAIVGGDFLLRSDLRLAEESTILKARNESDPVKAALAGESGVAEANGDLIAFTPLTFLGTQWAIIASQSLDEVGEPLDALLIAQVIATLISGLAVAVMGWLAARALVQPLTRMSDAMLQLAEGNLDVDVPEQDRGDELGKMASTVQVFKQNAIQIRDNEVEKSRRDEQAKIAEAEAQQNRRNEMLRMADELEENVGSIVSNVSQAASDMKSSATQMSNATQDTANQAGHVASASEQASVNVQTVAAAAEELNSSITEISRQVARSTEIAGRAASEAGDAGSRINGLVASAESIGEVVSLIQDIAEQTNLLALNATIEAARAGEAGKGFAVVATEVKNLASQTARATDEISSQIGGIRGSVTETAESIQRIDAVIQEMNEIASGVAAAIEEQNAATHEIARNVEQASDGTRNVTTSIEAVSIAANESESASGQIASAASNLSVQADQLSDSVGQFLKGLRSDQA